MNFQTKLATAMGCSLLLTGCATSYSIVPIEGSEGTVRYDKGRATAASQKERGAVRVTPLGVGPDMRITFGIAAFNKGEQSANFGTENIALASQDGTSIHVFTHGELEREAKNAAAAAMIVTALGGAAAAYNAQQNAYSTTTGTVRSSYGGTVSYSSRTYNPGVASLNTAIAGAATGATLLAIDRSLDDTLASLDGRILQTTTIDPGDVYGGQVVSERLKIKVPTPVLVRVAFNGESHEFRFLISPSQ